MSETAALNPSCQLVVIGAGPAGLAAATTAAKLGVDTVLLDEQPAPGGQIYRAITETPVTKRSILGMDYWHGAELVTAFRSSGARHVPGTTVWSVTREGEIGFSVGGAARLIEAERIILATGAQERPFPITGWTLPGVMTAGAAQILLKASGMVAEGRAVLAGTGPLLWLLAAQYLRAGGRIVTVLDTTPPANRRAALPYLPNFLGSDYLGAGIALLREVKARVPVIGDVRSLRLLGENRVREVVYQSGTAPERRIGADLVLLHQGVVPNLNLANAIGCRQEWHEDQLCFVPVIDAWGTSSIERVAIAGDGAGIAGARIAAERGRLAALEAAHRLGRIDAYRRDAEAVAPRRAITRFDKGRRFIDLMYRPRAEHRVPQGDTLACRCEEITAQQIVEAVKLGSTGPNQMKSLLRCGMGPCQGRLCGLTITELIASARGVSPADVGYFRLRPPIKPITLAELASLPKSEAAVQAVVRG